MPTATTNANVKHGAISTRKQPCALLQYVTSLTSAEHHPQIPPRRQIVLDDPALRELEVPSVRDPIADGNHDARGLSRFEDSYDCVGLGSFEIRVDEFVTTALWRVHDRDVALRGPVLHPALKLVGDVARRSRLPHPGCSPQSS